MATQHYRAIRECFAYNKRFKKGAEFPLVWLDAGYIPPPQWFVKSEDYDDVVRKDEPVGKIVSAAEDPRSSKQLVEDLEKYMTPVPKDWNRKRIWMELKRREMAESKTDTGVRKPGRPAMAKEA
jgi:hypothetical protein